MVVHGMHAVLWALNVLAELGGLPGNLGKINIQFRRFIYLDVDINIRVQTRADGNIRVDLLSDEITLVRIDLKAGDLLGETSAPLSAIVVKLSSPAAPSLNEVSSLEGCLPDISGAAFQVSFPHAARRLGAGRIARIAQLSTLVGMVCPGLNSIFSECDLQLVGDSPAGLSFKTVDVDAWSRRAEMAVSGGGLSGHIYAFIREAPVRQPSLSDLAAHVEPGEFRGVNALVVGGSRGLGAVAARLLAAGDGRLVISYAVGEADAVAVQDEIASQYGPNTCSILKLDVRLPLAEQLRLLDVDPTQVYYFATPRIFRQRSPGYSKDTFADFCMFYVDGFAELVKSLQTRAKTPLSVYYPSSVAVDDCVPGMLEYSMAKAAGERLVADMNRSQADVWVYTNRLPRVLTDQTATLLAVPSSDPVEVLLPVLRRMTRGPSHTGLST